MTTQITIKHDEPEQCPHLVRVTTILFEKGQSGGREVHTQDVRPGMSVAAFVHSLCDLRIQEVPSDYVPDADPPPAGPPSVLPTLGVSGVPRHERPSTCLPIGISPQVEEFLAGLVASGLYGSTHSEVAERLLCEKLREIAEGNMTICNLVSTSVESLFSKLSAVALPASPTMPSGPSSPGDCCPPGSKGF